MKEVKKKPVTVALWIPFVWYAISATRAFSYWLYPENADLTEMKFLEGSPLDRDIYIALIVAGIVALLFRKVRWTEIIRKNIWFLLLFAYMAASIFWSEFQDVAMKRFFKLFGSMVMALIVVTEPDPLEAMATVVKRVLLVHLPLSIITIKYFRTIGVEWSKDGNYAMWTGLTVHKNLLGQVCMTSGILFVWDMLRNRKNKTTLMVGAAYLLMTVYLMNGPGYSKSTTSMFVLLFGIATLAIVHLTRSNPKLLVKYVTGCFAASILLYVIFNLAVGAFTYKESLMRATVEASGRDMTFTGRTQLWSDMIDIASVHPVKGVGYGSFWIGDLANDLWEKHPWKPRQGHNGYLDVYVELGFIGLFLLAAVIVSGYNDIKNAFPVNFEYGKFRFVFLTMIVVHNLMETSFLRGVHNIWFLFLIVALSVPCVPKEESGAG
ncbi:MAG: O-antigen ligase family protein [Deltaproteobacteria bacterium]